MLILIWKSFFRESEWKKKMNSTNQRTNSPEPKIGFVFVINGSSSSQKVKKTLRTVRQQLSAMLTECWKRSQTQNEKNTARQKSTKRNANKIATSELKVDNKFILSFEHNCQFKQEAHFQCNIPNQCSATNGAVFFLFILLFSPSIVVVGALQHRSHYIYLTLFSFALIAQNLYTKDQSNCNDIPFHELFYLFHSFTNCYHQFDWDAFTLLPFASHCFAYPFRLTDPCHRIVSNIQNNHDGKLEHSSMVWKWSENLKHSTMVALVTGNSGTFDCCQSSQAWWMARLRLHNMAKHLIGCEHNNDVKRRGKCLPCARYKNAYQTTCWS